MTAWGISARRAVASVVSLALVVVPVVGLLAPGTASADSAPLDVANPRTPLTVTADALPTVQIDGVAWSQVVVGNTVYVAGKFTRARPAGAAPGTSETVRNNLLAYDIRTGALITSFAPDLNGQALVVTASPDGRRIYVGGDFNRANGQTRYRVAAYDTATGALVPNWGPAVNGRVRAIVATDTTVYLGGGLSAIGSTPRTRLAAVSATNGALLPWAPVPGVGPTDGNTLYPQGDPRNDKTSDEVMAMVLTGGGSQVVVGGRFDTLNGVKATGVGALDPVTGATRPFAANQVITNQGVNAAVYSLSTDGTTVYGTGYDYYGPGNLEGSFSATADGGAVQTINDCHGDTYSSFPLGGALYLAGHPHDCGNIGGFPEENPRINKFATAVSLAPAGTVGGNTMANSNFVGKPAPALLPWFPTMEPGKVTGQAQAGWSVAGNSQYIVYGGEFPRVNGTPQAGLVRYALPTIAPNKVAPKSNDGLTPTVASTSAGAARVSWQATFDDDNQNLRYQVIRNDRPTLPVFETTAPSTFWDRPTLGFVDRGLTPGSRYTYKVVAYDPFGNSASRGTTAVTVSGDTAAGGLYAETVLADSPTHYWRLGEAAGATRSYDQAAFDDLALGTGVTSGTAGALAGTGNTAADFDGSSNGTAATPSAVAGPQNFGVEAWFRTTTTTGGKIVGFGSRATGTSDSYDRHVYMDDSGRVHFGVWLGYGATLQTAPGLNDGSWHHVVGSVGPDGMTMYLDGRLVGQRSDATGAQAYNGYWRVGGDTAWAGSSPWFDGQIDEVATYAGPLTAAQVQRHFVTGSTGETYNEPPTAAFTSAATGLVATFDGSASADTDGTVRTHTWDFGDGSTGTGASVGHTYAAPGSYRVTLTVTDDRGATSSASRSVAVAATGTVGGPYSEAVLADGASHYWRLGETAGDALDFAGTADLEVGSGVTRGIAGAVVGDADSAAAFDGSGEGRASTRTRAPGPDLFSVETWFRTTSTAGGKIIGYGNRSSGNSSNYDRHLYMDESGRLSFGVWTGAMSIVQSGTGLNDGRWHHVVGSLSPAGLALYVDGQPVAQRDDVRAGEAYEGFWRIGGDSTWAGANYFAGDLDDVAVYPAALPAGTVAEHWRLGTSTPPPPPANQAPTAAFAAAVSDLRVQLDGSGSGDADGSVTGYAWDFGDGTTGTGATTSHTYATAGEYTVQLTVTDDDGATSSVQQVVTATAPRVNQPPVAAFSTAASGLTATADGSGSSDADGTLASYAWDFGDGRTATGATTSHTYAAGGTYTVRLTVTDDEGATASVEHPVTVTAPPPAVAPVAADAFERSVSSGLGRADVGGAWTAAGGALSVAGGVGQFQVAAPGGSAAAMLNAVSVRDLSFQVGLSLDRAPTGGGTYAYLTARRTSGSNMYRTSVKFQADGKVVVALLRNAGGTEVALRTLTLPGTYAPGSVLQVKLDVAGAGTTTLRAKAWTTGTAEPVDWQLTATDTTASLQTAGVVGVSAYVSGSAAAVPVRLLVDDLWIGASGTSRPTP
ncbi:PKD domain-containing protein [Blastococcus aurantiacus]|uniref:PKD domain-containing protein n=1 Tax=Blastococcus aurantiacus TaxID=1550231 RepID=A0A1G7JPZ9_9ACTN|nr:PKD domain-containing protein [Blastococcus aurantiacus]SDF27038.1 PKD domain-containing protein [Blastococcus aurantiacus]